MATQGNLYSGESALRFVQLSISFFKSCFEKHNFYFLLFQQLSLKLIDNCTSGTKISLDNHCYHSKLKFFMDLKPKQKVFTQTSAQKPVLKCTNP